MQSGIVFGLSAALHGHITLKSGRGEQGSLNRLVLTARDPLGDGGTTTPPPPFRRPGLRRSAQALDPCRKLVGEDVNRATDPLVGWRRWHIPWSLLLAHEGLPDQR
jgi:hypothetical protein